MTKTIRVLHVDDDAAFADMTAEFLRRSDLDIDVVTATGTDEGIEMLEEGEIDCIVSDYEMPDRDGLAFLDAVRESFGDVPFILFTGRGSEEVASEAIASGATDYLQKHAGSDQYDLLVNRISNAVEQFRAERERARNERRFRTVFEDPHMLVQLLDSDGRLLRANRRSLAYVPDGLDSLAGERFWETPWWARDQREDVKRWVQRAVDGEYTEFEAKCEAIGRTYHLLGTIRPVTGDGGDVTSIIVSSQEITAQKQREAELREKTRALEAVLDTVEAGIVMKDAESRYALINRAWREQLGIPPEASVEGLTDYELFPAPIAAGFRREDRRVLQEGTAIEVEHEVPTMAGSRVHLTHKTPVIDEHGSIEGLCAVSSDITDRKGRERALERANQHLDTILSNAPLVLFVLDSEGRITLLRGRGLEAFGVEPEAAVGESIFDVYGQHEGVLELVRNTLNGTPSRGRHRVEDAVFETVYRPVETEGEAERVIGVSIAVTDRTRHEAELDVFRELVETAAIGLYRLDDELVFEYANPAMEGLLGYENGALVGKALEEVVGQDGLVTAESLLERAVDAGETIVSGELDHLTAAGALITCEVQFKPILENGQIRGTIGAVRQVFG